MTENVYDTVYPEVNEAINARLKILIEGGDAFKLIKFLVFVEAWAGINLDKFTADNPELAKDIDVLREQAFEAFTVSLRDIMKQRESADPKIMQWR